MLKNDRFLVLAATAAGVVLAAVLTLLQPSVYRADASIALVRQGQPPGDDPALARAAEAAAELFHSRAVAEPTIANLRLDESPDDLLDRVEIETEPQSSLVRVGVEAPSAERARQTAQELVEVSTVLFNDRFGPQTAATIWETPRAQDDPVSPRRARNLALGALLGALAGTALAGSRRLPNRQPALPRLPRPRLPRRAPRPVANPTPTPDPFSGPEAPPVPELAPAVVEAGSGWTVAAVQRLLDDHGDEFPERAEEFRIYVDSFRDVADADGSLPPGVTIVVEDVFADLIELARRQMADQPAAP